VPPEEPFSKPPVPSQRLDFQAPTAVTDIRNAALADLVEFSLFTGVRRGEALGLTCASSAAARRLHQGFRARTRPRRWGVSEVLV